MNPLDMFYSWQSVVMAAVVAGATQVFKTTLTGAVAPAVARHPLVKQVVVPAFPPVLGVILSVLVPVHPEALDAFVRAQGGGVGVYALWGAALGVFSDYLYQRVKSVSAGPVAVSPAAAATVAEVTAVVSALEGSVTPAVSASAPVAPAVSAPAAPAVPEAAEVALGVGEVSAPAAIDPQPTPTPTTDK